MLKRLNDIDAFYAQACEYILFALDAIITKVKLKTIRKMASKRKKIIQHLVKCIEHDFGFYNPEWKWSSLPDNIKDNYDLIENTLLEWKEKEYIDIYFKDDIRYLKIIKVPEL